MSGYYSEDNDHDNYDYDDKNDHGDADNAKIIISACNISNNYRGNLYA